MLGELLRDRSGSPGDRSVREPLVARLTAALADRLPPGASGARFALGRHWWLPALVAVGALAIAAASVRFGGDPTVASAPPAPVPAASSPADRGSAPPTPTATPDSSAPVAVPTASGTTGPSGAPAGTPPPQLVVDVVGRAVEPASSTSHPGPGSVTRSRPRAG